MDSETIDPDISKLHLSPQSLKTLHSLQQNDNEALNEHINELSRICTWMGRYLNGFDPLNQEEVKVVQAIAAISNTIAVLEKLSHNEITTKGD